MQAIECAGVEKKYVTFAHIQPSFRHNSIQIISIDVAARLCMRDINAGGLGIEEVERHLIDGGSLWPRIQMAEGIDMCRAMIAHQQTPRLIRETTFEILDRLLMKMVLPDHGFQMAWIDLHTLINFLTKIDDPGHRLTSFELLLQSAIMSS